MDEVNQFLESVDTLNSSGKWLSDQIEIIKKSYDGSTDSKNKVEELRGRAKSWVRDFRKLGIEEILNEE